MAYPVQVRTWCFDPRGESTKWPTLAAPPPRNKTSKTFKNRRKNKENGFVAGGGVREVLLRTPPRNNRSPLEALVLHWLTLGGTLLLWCYTG